MFQRNCIRPNKSLLGLAIRKYQILVSDIMEEAENQEGIGATVVCVHEVFLNQVSTTQGKLS